MLEGGAHQGQPLGLKVLQLIHKCTVTLFPSRLQNHMSNYQSSLVSNYRTNYESSHEFYYKTSYESTYELNYKSSYETTRQVMSHPRFKLQVKLGHIYYILRFTDFFQPKCLLGRDII